MQLKREVIDQTPEKNIIIGCVVSDKFIKEFLQWVTDFSLFESKEFRLIGSWCINYYSKYKNAPKDHIFDIFEVEKVNLDNKVVEYISKVLKHLSKYFDKDDFNADYFLANAKKYIDERHLMTFSDKIKGLSLKGETERAYAEVTGFKKIENSVGMGIDIINDADFVTSIFEDPDEDLFPIQGDLGKCIQAKYAGDVMGIGARQKLGKTWFLMWLGMQAAKAGKKVCYYTLEMKGSIMGKRIFKSLSGTLDPGVEADVVIPFFVEQGGAGYKKYTIDYEWVKPKSLSLEKCRREQRALKIATKGGGFKLFDRSTGGTTMEQIEYSLENLEAYDDYLCDIAIIDYDDIVEVNGPDGRDDRSRLNHVWLYAKKIASERNMLVILASQNGRQTFKRDADVDDISGDIRKFSHVSHWITLNQSPEEKKAKLMRVKVEGRHGDFNPLDEVVCLQNLMIGSPVLASCFKRNITNFDKWVEDMNSEEELEEV